MTDDGSGITYMTPAMDFSKAEKMIKEYRFSSFVRVDASPEKIVTPFPDAYERKIFQWGIPSSGQSKDRNLIFFSYRKSESPEMLLALFTEKSKERKIISFLHIRQKTPRFLSILFLPAYFLSLPNWDTIKPVIKGFFASIPEKRR
jgi:hypothetical protein